MRGRALIAILFFTTLHSSVAGSIEELLRQASAVIEGTVVSADVSETAITLQITASSVLAGPVNPGDTVAVACNGLKYVVPGPHPGARPQIYFLQFTKAGAWACMPASLLGHSGLGFLGYPQAPPCKQGDLQFLAAKSVREKILVRVAESALCGALHVRQTVLEAASPGQPPLRGPVLRPSAVNYDFDRRVFKGLVKSERRDVEIEGINGLIWCGDPLPFDLLAKNVEKYKMGSVQEWRSILSSIESSLRDPSVIPQLEKLLTVKDPMLTLAAATALQRFHTPAAVIHLGTILENPELEKNLALVDAKGLADFANGCPMTTWDAFRTPADHFPRCDEKFAFRTEESAANARPNPDVPGDDDWHITYWKRWWLLNDSRVAALAELP